MSPHKGPSIDLERREGCLVTAAADGPYTVDLTSLKVADPLFSHYMELVSEVVIPYQ